MKPVIIEVGCAYITKPKVHYVEKFMTKPTLKTNSVSLSTPKLRSNNDAL